MGSGSGAEARLLYSRTSAASDAEGGDPAQHARATDAVGPARRAAPTEPDDLRGSRWRRGALRACAAGTETVARHAIDQGD